MGDMASLVISPGNMDGGMSTIAEKAMGSICKGGTSNINQVVDYGAVHDRPSAVLMSLAGP